MNGSLDASLIWNATGSLFTETMLIDNSTYIPNITMMNTDGVRVQNDFSQFLDGTGGNLGLGQIGCTGDTTGTILDTMVSHGLIESRVYSLWLTQSSCDNLNQYPECASKFPRSKSRMCWSNLAYTRRQSLTYRRERHLWLLWEYHLRCC